MRSGIKFKDIEIGSGQEVKSPDWVLVELRVFLHKGEEIEVYSGHPDHQFVINLKSRDFIPGLRYGIVGMREGGTRDLKIGPHLAYGAKGVPDKIPPNALIICKVKLLKIVEPGFHIADPFHRRRQIIVSNRGEAARNLPRWQFGVIADGEFGIQINYPIPGMTWRHTRNRKYNGQLTQEEADEIFTEVQNFPKQFPDDVVEYNDVWADMSEPAGNTPRQRSTNRLCISVVLYGEAAVLISFYVTEDNREFQDTRLYKLILEVLGRPELH